MFQTLFIPQQKVFRIELPDSCVATKIRSVFRKLATLSGESKKENSRTSLGPVCLGNCCAHIPLEAKHLYGGSGLVVCPEMQVFIVVDVVFENGTELSFRSQTHFALDVNWMRHFSNLNAKTEFEKRF